MKNFESVNDILNFAIEQEQKAIDFYTSLANKAKTEDMKKVFEEFTKEEISHKARLTKILNEGIINFKYEEVKDLKIADYVVPEEPTEDITYEQALKLAMNKEKAAFRLYTNLAQKVTNPELKNVFNLLAIEESKHKLRFEIEYDEYVLREN